MRSTLKSIRVRLLPDYAKRRIDRLRRAYGLRWPPAGTREHEHLMRDFYSQFVSSGDLCFDVGANMGNRTRVLQSLGTHVVAVEPQAECARLLKIAYRLNRRVRVLHVALGETEGETEMMIASANVLSTLSRDWVEAVVASGRFVDVSWNRSELVRVSTLDELIRVYGAPRFVKIDVEGYEYQVLKGLSSPVAYLSFEFTPECGRVADACVDRLCELGMGWFNFSPGESMQLALKEWVSSAELKRTLSRFAREPMAFGDVYAAAEREG